MRPLVATGAAALNLPLIGIAGGRLHLETPALVLDLGRLKDNIASMSRLALVGGVTLRPHAKTHKSAAIARLQIEAGATGIACAKPGELLALFEAGIRSLLLTSPVASPSKIEKLAGAAAAGADLTVAVDRPELVRAYAEAADRHAVRIGVLVDVDVGLGRTGVDSIDAVVDLAKAIAREPSLRFMGIQAYAGQIQHVEDFWVRDRLNRGVHDKARAIADALKRAGLNVEVVSGGGTGSHRNDIDVGVFTELQVGSYVFMDELYRPVDLDGLSTSIFSNSLFVAVTVIAHSPAGAAIVDAGSKSIAIDGPLPIAHLEGVAVGRIEWVGDEFGRLAGWQGDQPLPIGTRLECTTPHCDPTVNLHDVFHVLQDDRLVEFWPVDARGRSD